MMILKYPMMLGMYRYTDSVFLAGGCAIEGQRYRLLENWWFLTYPSRDTAWSRRRRSHQQRPTSSSPPPLDHRRAAIDAVGEVGPRGVGQDGGRRGGEGQRSGGASGGAAGGRRVGRGRGRVRRWEEHGGSGEAGGARTREGTRLRS